MKKVFQWLFNLCFLFLIVLVGLVLATRVNKSGTVLGFRPLKVLSGSMEPTIKAGDLIIVRDVEDDLIKTGDVITYETRGQTLITHRVVDVVEDRGGLMFKTKGDANNIEDQQLIEGRHIVGRYVCRLPKLGFFSDLMFRPIGFILFFILPIIILLSKEIVRFKNA